MCKREKTENISNEGDGAEMWELLVYVLSAFSASIRDKEIHFQTTVSCRDGNFEQPSKPGRADVNKTAIKDTDTPMEPINGTQNHLKAGVMTHS